MRSLLTTDLRTVVRPREVVREAIACGASQLLCVRSDPHGHHEATAADVENARRVKRAVELLDMTLMDYAIIGRRSVTSLLQRRVI